MHDFTFHVATIEDDGGNTPILQKSQLLKNWFFFKVHCTFVLGGEIVMFEVILQSLWNLKQENTLS